MVGQAPVWQRAAAGVPNGCARKQAARRVPLRRQLHGKRTASGTCGTLQQQGAKWGLVSRRAV